MHIRPAFEENVHLLQSGTHETPTSNDLAALTSPPVTPVYNEDLLGRWKNTLRIDKAADTTSAQRLISEETAKNYLRYARNLLNYANEHYPPLTTLPELPLLGVIGEYFRGVEQRNAASGRAVRSAITSHFLPWCVTHGYLNLTQKSIDCFSPVPLHKYSSPISRAFISSSPSLPVSTTEATRFYRSVHYWIATRVLGIPRCQLTHDSRGLLAREVHFAALRIVNDPSLSLQLVNRSEQSQHLSPAPSELLCEDRTVADDFIRSRNNPHTPGVAHTLIDLYASSLRNASEVINRTHAENGDLIASFVTATRHELTTPIFAPDPPIELRTSKAGGASEVKHLARRSQFSKVLQDQMTLRDATVDYLVKNLRLSFSDVTQLQRGSITEKMKEVCDAYTSLRSAALRELSVRDGDKLPYLISADGGQLVVKEEPLEEHNTISASKLVILAEQLITALLQLEDLPFSTITKMSTSDLQGLSLGSEETRSRRTTYLSAAQVSDLKFFILQREGPRIAFPGVDGDALTADFM